MVAAISQTLVVRGFGGFFQVIAGMVLGLAIAASKGIAWCGQGRTPRWSQHEPDLRMGKAVFGSGRLVRTRKPTREAGRRDNALSRLPSAR